MAESAVRMDFKGLSTPFALAPPAMISRGAAGKGKPMTSRKTKVNRMPYPCSAIAETSWSIQLLRASLASVRPVDFLLYSEFNAGRRQRQRDQLTLQCNAQHFVHVLDEMQLHHIADELRNIRQVFLVVLRDNHFVDPWTVHCEQLFFQPADGEHLAAKSDFTRHGQIAAHRNLRKRTADGGCDGDTGGRPVLRDGAFRNMQVHVEIPVEITRETQCERAGPPVTESRLRRFLHHIAQLAGYGE